MPDAASMRRLTRVESGQTESTDANMPKKKSSNVALIRGLIIGGVGLLAALVIGYGLLYTTGATQDGFVAGEHYEVIETAERRRPGSNVDVVEYFSYACVHCKNFDPLISEWLTTKPDNVDFKRVPVTFSPQWILLAQTYYTLVALDILEENHDRIFRRIHNARRMFDGPEDVAEFIDGNGATTEAFLEAWNGAEVRRMLREGEVLQREVVIAAVPTLVVNGSYLVGMDVGRKVALEVVDHLIALEQGNAPASASTD
jgi:thiol:disulfide interchange protein DsbA